MYPLTQETLEQKVNEFDYALEKRNPSVCIHVSQINPSQIHISVSAPGYKEETYELNIHTGEWIKIYG